MDQKTFFLGNLYIEEPSVTASVVFEKLLSYLTKRGIKIDKILGFGSDGASLMVGRKAGVATLMKKLCPHLVSVHCFAHRLALCTSKAAETASYIQKTFQKTMSDLFYYFKHSTKRIEELKGIQQVLEHEEIRLKEVHDVRWFSFYSALFAIYLSWKPLVKFFKSMKQPNDKEKIFLKVLTDIRFLSVMHMLMDVIPPFTQLNILFQKQNIDIAAVPAALEGAIDCAKRAKEGKSHYQTEFHERLKVNKEGGSNRYSFKDENLSNRNQKEDLKEFRETRTQFIDSVISNVEKRFPKESADIVFAFGVLGMRPLSFLSQVEFQSYGLKEMKILTDFYGKEQKTDKTSAPLLNQVECIAEWTLLKKMVLEQNYPRDQISTLWKLLAEHHRETFPNMMKLGQLALLMPLQTADCERGFSAQNNIHTASRNALKPETLERLMTIMLEGPTCEQFDFERAVSKWRLKKERRLFKQ